MRILKLFIIFFLTSFIKSEVVGQELLKANVEQVKAYMKTQGGILKSESFTLDILMNTEGKELVFDFPPAKIEQNGISSVNLSFSINGSCIHYTTWYKDDKFMQALIKRYDGPESGFKRQNKDLKWVSKNNDILVFIAKNNSQIKYLAFVLDVRIKTNNPLYKSSMEKQVEEIEKQIKAEKTNNK